MMNNTDQHVRRWTETYQADPEQRRGFEIERTSHQFAG